MSSSDTAALCITAFLGVVIIVISVIMLCGKGAMLIAGFNAMPKPNAKNTTPARCANS